MQLRGSHSIEFIAVEYMVDHGFEFLGKLLHGLICFKINQGYIDRRN